jgi:hypothetical protein
MVAGRMLFEMLQQNNAGLKALELDWDLHGWTAITGTALETNTRLESLEWGLFSQVNCGLLINSLPNMRGLKKLSLSFTSEVAEMKEDLFDAFRQNTSLEEITVVAEFLTADDQRTLQLLAERNVMIKRLLSVGLLPSPRFDPLQCKNAVDVMHGCVSSWNDRLEQKTDDDRKMTGLCSILLCGLVCSGFKSRDADRK